MTCLSRPSLPTPCTAVDAAGLGTELPRPCWGCPAASPSPASPTGPRLPGSQWQLSPPKQPPNEADKPEASPTPNSALFSEVSSEMSHKTKFPTGCLWGNSTSILKGRKMDDAEHRRGREWGLLTRSHAGREAAAP